MLDHVHIINREVIARGNLLRRHPETLTENEDIEITARDVLFRLEDLKRLDERFGTDLGIQGNTLKSGDEGIFKFLRHDLDILRMEVATGLDMAKERPGLPMEMAKPVLFRLRVLVAVCLDILTVHQLVEGKLHCVFTVGKAIVAAEAVDKPDAELLVEFGPSRIVEYHFFIIFHIPHFINHFRFC